MIRLATLSLCLSLGSGIATAANQAAGTDWNQPIEHSTRPPVSASPAEIAALRQGTVPPIKKPIVIYGQAQGCANAPCPDCPAVHPTKCSIVLNAQQAGSITDPDHLISPVATGARIWRDSHQAIIEFRSRDTWIRILRSPHHLRSESYPLFACSCNQADGRWQPFPDAKPDEIHEFSEESVPGNDQAKRIRHSVRRMENGYHIEEIIDFATIQGRSHMELTSTQTYEKSERSSNSSDQITADRMPLPDKELGYRTINVQLHTYGGMFHETTTQTETVNISPDGIRHVTRKSRADEDPNEDTQGNGRRRFVPMDDGQPKGGDEF